MLLTKKFRASNCEIVSGERLQNLLNQLSFEYLRATIALQQEGDLGEKELNNLRQKAFDLTDKMRKGFLTYDWLCELNYLITNKRHSMLSRGKLVYGIYDNDDTN